MGIGNLDNSGLEWGAIFKGNFDAVIFDTGDMRGELSTRKLRDEGVLSGSKGVFTEKGNGLCFAHFHTNNSFFEAWEDNSFPNLKGERLLWWRGIKHGPIKKGECIMNGYDILRGSRKFHTIIVIKLTQENKSKDKGGN